MSQVFSAECRLEDETLDILNVMGPSFSNYYSVRESCEM